MNVQSQPLTQQSRDLRSGHSGNLRMDDSGDLSTLFNVDLQREESTITGQLVPTTTDDLATRDAVADEEARIPTHQNPLVKGGVVVAGVSALVGVAAYLYLQSNQPQAVAAKPTPTSTPQLFESKTVEGGDVKAELALSKQRQELSLVAANQTPATAAATPNPHPAAKQSAAAAATPTPAAAPAATPIRPYTPPPQVIASRPVLTRPVEPPAPTYTPARVEPIRATANIPKVRLTRTIEPTPTVVAAVTVSRPQPMLPTILTANPKPPLLRPTAPTGYSQTPGGIYRPTAPNPTPALSWQQQATAGTFGGRFGKGAIAVVATNPTAPAAAQTPTPPPLASEQYVINRAAAPSPKIILAGARVYGQMLNPIQLVAGDVQGQTVMISLVQPLTSNDGKLALPAGSTQIAFKVNAVDNGWVRGVSDKVYVNGQELAVPAGSFTLTSQTGEPLVAKSIQFGNDEIAAQNRTSFIYGALQNVGSVLTQPNTQSTVSSGIGGFSSSSSSQSNPNIFGAVLQGGFNPLAQQQTQRSQAEIQQLLKATRLWFLPQGTNVQISVNQPLTVSLPPS